MQQRVLLDALAGQPTKGVSSDERAV